MNEGRFRVTGAFVRDDPVQVAEVFSLLRVVITAAWYDEEADVYDYNGLSAEFDPVTEDGELPLYDIQVYQVNGCPSVAKFVRI